MARISPFFKSAIKRGKIELAPNQGTIESLHRRQIVEWHIYTFVGGQRTSQYTAIKATVERLNHRIGMGLALDSADMAEVARPQTDHGKAVVEAWLKRREAAATNRLQSKLKQALSKPVAQQSQVQQSQVQPTTQKSQQKPVKPATLPKPPKPPTKPKKASAKKLTKKPSVLTTTIAEQPHSFFVDVVKTGATVERAKRELTDVTKTLRRVKVSKYITVEDFARDVLKVDLVPGAAYYQLVKAETLLQGRKIILQPRDKSGALEQIFLTGPAVRPLLGLPSDRDCKLEPKNLGDFVVYLQSASPTRKLTPGSLCLYDEAHVPGATDPTFTYGKKAKA